MGVGRMGVAVGGLAVGGGTRVGVGGGGGGEAITGTSSASVAITKSADTQPTPPGRDGASTTHQRLSSLRPTIVPLSPLRAAPITGKLVPGPERMLSTLAPLTVPVGVLGSGAGRSTISFLTAITAMASSAVRSQSWSPSMRKVAALSRAAR